MSIEHYFECNSEFQKVLKLCFIKHIAFLLLDVKQKLECGLRAVDVRGLQAGEIMFPNSIKEIMVTDKI